MSPSPVPATNLLPSADDEAVSHAPKILLVVQVAPKSFETYMPPLGVSPIRAGPVGATEISLFPSADEVIEREGPPKCAPLVAHAIPEFVEVKIMPPTATAANLAPFADEVIEYQPLVGTQVGVQVKPELAET